jgi:phosphatidylinositol alpha-mannosyltransferase
MVGVLMSATLPARLGEPARALALARRTGRMRETFPVLLGTLVSQTMLNILALFLLGVIIVSTTDLFHSGTQKLFAFSFVPLALLLLVLLAPALMRRAGHGRLARAGAAVPEPSCRCARASWSSVTRAAAAPPPWPSSEPGRSS